MKRKCFGVVAGLSGSLMIAAHAQAQVRAQAIAAEGQAAPGSGGRLINNLNSPFTDGNGRVGFTGSVDNGDGGNLNFVWYNTGVIWLNTDGLPDVLTGAEGTMGVSNTGQFIYSPSVNGNDSAWTNNGLLMTTGDPLPDFPGQYATFSSRPQMGRDGTAYWISGMTVNQGSTTSQGRVLYKSSGAGAGTPSSILATGMMVDGFTIDLPAGVGFSYKFSDNGSHHIQALLLDTGSTTNDDAIYVNGSIVARELSPNGSGIDNWDNFDDVGINNAGNYVFSGDTDGATTSDEFIAYNGSIALREGSTVDGRLLSGASVNSVSINNRDEVAHIWNTSGGEFLFFGRASDLLNSSIVLLATGDLVDLDGDTIGDATVMDFNASPVIGPGLDLADDGFVYVEVDLRDVGGATDYEAILKLVVPEPGSLLLLGLGALALVRRRR